MHKSIMLHISNPVPQKQKMKLLIIILQRTDLVMIWVEANSENKIP